MVNAIGFLKSKTNHMRKIYYYYDPVMKSKYERCAIDYYCTDGEHTVWSGRINGDSYDETLQKANEIVSSLNKPRPLFGCNGRLAQWFWWMKRIRN